MGLQTRQKLASLGCFFAFRVQSPTGCLVGQHHFHHVVAEVAEGGDQLGQGEEVGDGVGLALLGHFVGGGQLPPVGLADEDDAAGAQALRQQRDGAGNAPGDPAGTDAGGYIDLLVSDMARRIAMDEADLTGHAQLHRTALGLRGEQGAHVDARADDAVVARPSAQHLARSTAQVKHPRPRRQTQRRTERGVFVRRERVVNAVGAFGDVEYAGDVHWGELINLRLLI